jgi:Uma2 family endonuclease
MPPSIETRATLDDLYSVEGKAELIGGRIVRFTGTGRRPSLTAGRIYRRLFDHSEVSRRGEVHFDGMTYGVPELSSGRESFMPDISYYFGPFPANDMRWIDGPPTFAVEVRSEHDYGPSAEAEQAAKRLDYFEAGTLVVWDVDALGELIHAYRREDTTRATTFARGDLADAEPAVPGWRIAVNEVFGPIDPA